MADRRSDTAILAANARAIRERLGQQPFAAQGRTHMAYEPPEWSLFIDGARGAATAERFFRNVQGRHPEYELWILDGGGRRHANVHAALAFIYRHKQRGNARKPWYAGVYREHNLAQLFIRGKRI